MKIAVIMPLLVPIPPLKYGGIEQVAYEIIQELGRRGHEVTVFCSGGSTISGPNIKRIEASPYPTTGHGEINRGLEINEIKEVLKRQSEFDVIHSHYEPTTFRIKENEKEVNLLDQFKTPVVFTFHFTTNIPENIEYYRNTISLYRHNMVFISENQRSFVPFFPNSRVIYNGLPPERFSLESKKEDYMFFLGRLNPDKGALQAIEVALKVKVPLVIAGKVDPTDKKFYEEKVKGLIDGKLIRYVGEVGHDEKVEYLKKARCILFPIQWDEPFGLVMIEALACGTPVVALRRGSVPEIIEAGVSGFVVKNLDEMAKAISKCGDISPLNCRKSFEDKFTARQMIDKYEALFKELTDSAAN